MALAAFWGGGKGGWGFFFFEGFVLLVVWRVWSGRRVGFAVGLGFVAALTAGFGGIAVVVGCGDSLCRAGQASAVRLQ